MKNPVFNIFINNVDMSDIISSIRYEDSVEKSSMLSFSIVTIEDIEFLTGSPVDFNFGFLKGLNSGIQRLYIADINYNYSNVITVNIKCSDKGVSIKKTSSNKVWKNITTSQIVSEIAGKYSLDNSMDYSGMAWESLPQGNLSDWDFLQDLARKEKDGNFICYINNDTIFFTKRGLDNESVLLFEYGKNIIRFVPKTKSITRKREDIQPKINNTEITEKAGVDLGKFKHVFDEFANKLGVSNGETSSANITSPEKSDTVKENQAQHTIKKGSLETLTATLTIEMNPTIQINDIITVGGVYKRHRGNYIVSSIVHTINNSGAITELNLKKNASRIVSDKKAGVENTSVGKEEGNSTKSVTVFDENGEVIATSKGEDYYE